jgi:glycosyltransferase involved in cell wall biosynthesis
MKIAFQVFPGEHWLGGVITCKDLLIALRALDSGAPTIALVVWENTPESDYAAVRPYTDETLPAQYPSATVSPPAPPSLSRRQRMMRRLGRPAPPPAPDPQAAVLRTHGVDCSFSVVLEGRRDTSVPLLTWFYDFQHRQLPQLFSPEERELRDRILMREADLAARAVVQSASVAEDFRAFAPLHAGKVRVVRWVSHIPASVYAQDPAALLAQYHLPEKFFYLPNQFWKHKNHEVVFQALHQLQARGVFPFVVCSGSLIDSRDPTFGGQLLQRLSLLNLREQVALLNVVPREHVYLLMRQAVRVLNPSLFEGFGLSVAECKSLGKRPLLADLPVLREHEAPGSLYFDPHDAGALADCLEMLWRTAAPGPDLELEAAARAELPRRQAAFAQSFMAVANEAIGQQGL